MQGKSWRWFRRLVLYPLAVMTTLSAAATLWYFSTLYRAGATQEGVLALTGARVLVGSELESQEGMTILIEDGVILEVGKDNEVAIPAGASVLALDGYSVMPGLIDLHVHMGAPALEAGEEMSAEQVPGIVLDAVRFVPQTRRDFLAYGVTTVRSVGDDYEWAVEMRQLLSDGELEGPRLFTSGPLFTTRGGHPVATLFGGDYESNAGGLRLPTTAEEAREAVRALATEGGGVDHIKVVQERGRAERALEPLLPEILNAIVEEAHRHGLPVVAHWGTQADLEEVVAAGVDDLEHVGRIEGGWQPALLEKMIAQEISLTPTLAVMAVKAPPAGMERAQRLAWNYYEAGGRVVVGSDAGMPGVPFGLGVHHEMEWLVASGFTPREALRAATSEAAVVLRHEQQLGIIAEGYAADLVVVAGDPLADITAARTIVLVFRDGRLVVDRQ